MKDTSKNEIEKCIKRIEDIRNIDIDYEKFTSLKDLFYIMEIINNLNFKFKNQIESVSNKSLTKKFEVVDFVGSTITRIDLEFKYFKNHLTLLWPEKYSIDKTNNLLTK